MALGVLEMACVVGLLLPAILRRHGSLVPLAAGVLAAESLVLMWAHAQYGETAQMAMVLALGLLMAFLRHRELIDHIILTRSMNSQVVDVRVVDDLPMAQVASDHYPVMITIKPD